jgi:two-component system OmpR family sensor kinase
MRTRLRSLRARLLAGVLALAAVCLAVLAVIVYAQQRSFLVDRVDDQAESAQPLAERALNEAGVPGPDGRDAGDAFGRRPPGDGRGPGPRTTSLPPGVFAERRDANGTPQGDVTLTYGEAAPSPPRLPASLPLDDVVTVPSEDGSLDYRVDASPAPGGWTTVVAIPLSGVDEQLDRLLIAMLAVIGGVLLLMAAVGWWVVGVGLRPLDRMGATAGRIAGGDLSQRVAPAEPGTEVGRLGLALNAMLHQIEQAFAERTASEERLRTFLADASHELRTPLASIRGYAELFRMGAARDGEDAERAMTRIEQEAARMGVLVEDLLLLARLDETRERERDPVDLAELARDAAGDARAADRDRPVALAVPGDGAVVVGDADELRQVVGNLVRNAIVHTPPRTPVAITVTPAGDSVRLEVADEGPGLPVEDGRELFERFWRAAPARGRGPAGAGLGLAIVDAIVAAHGGTVSAETRPEGGARFVVELPTHLALRRPP